ncbi:SDR family oxidoreductase [Streptomyces sp. NPDC002577]
MTARSTWSADGFQGRTVLVTGGGRSIGRSISLAFARRGAHVVVNCFHSEPEARRTLADLRDEGGSGQLVRASVGNPAGVRSLFDTVAGSCGHLDVLVNNASFGVLGDFEELTDDDWQRSLDVSLHGVRRCVEAAIPLMAGRPGAAIVNLSAQHAHSVLDRYTAMATCRGALESLSRYLAAELGPRGIRLNTVAPGLVDSAAVDYWPDGEARRARARAGAALGRMPRPDDIADAVVFLASDAARAITGTSLVVDAGMSLWTAATPPLPTTPGPVASGRIKRDAAVAPAPPCLAESQQPANAAVPRDSAAWEPPAAQPAPRHVHGSQHAVAVVGMGIAVPGAGSPDEFWHLLHQDHNAFSEPAFSLDNWFSDDPKAEDKSYVRKAGYLRDFTPHPRLADEADGACGTGGNLTARILRHCLLQALDTVTVEQSDRLGAYVGTLPSSLALEEATLLAAASDADAARDRPGPLRQALAARYTEAAPEPREAFPDRMIQAACAGLLPEGSELLAVDTACSSSLYAVDLGVKSLLAGERDVVLCGGANTGPRRDLVLFSKLQGLSRTGQVRAFDTDADGVLFSDAAAIVALKRLDRALADGDEVLGVLGGFGASVDGTGSVMAPDPEGQKRAVQRARAVNSTDPSAVDWIVGHGTGTRVGDASELEGLAELAGSARHLCTSNKPLVGHGAWAAGAVSLVHALLALRHQSIPGERYFTRLPDGIRAGQITVPVADTPWQPRPHRPRTAGICAYGLGGGNAHLLLHGPESSTAPPRALPPAHDDPVVLVGWHAHLPGALDRHTVVAWLRGEAEAPEPSFGDQYPLPPFRQLKMPPVSARSIDRTHLMVIEAAAGFVEQYGELWEPYRETTGVFTGHMGPTRAMAEYSVRLAADDMLAAVRQGQPGKDSAGRLQDYLDRLRGRLPAANEASMPGQLANVISCQVANRHRLGGMAMALDCGRASSQAALHTACRYLRSGELDVALVLGASGNTGAIGAELAGKPAGSLAEGAVLLVLSRRSRAEQRGWDVLAEIRTTPPDAPDRPGPGLPEIGLVESAADYMGAEGALALLRAVHLGVPAAVLRNEDAGPRVYVTTLAQQPSAADTPAGSEHTSAEREEAPHRAAPAQAAALPALRDRSVVVHRRRDVVLAEGAGTARHAIRPGTLILVDSATSAQALAGRARRCGARIVCTDPSTPGSDVVTVVERRPDGEEPDALAEAVRRAVGRARDLLVVCSARRVECTWPAPPPAGLLRLQECALIAVQQMEPDASGSAAALLLDPLHGHTTHPHLTLFTGFWRSLALELPCPAFAVVTDATLEAGLAQVAAERGARRDRTVVHYRQGLRYVEQVVRSPLPAARYDAALAFGPDAVIVATGGARGATAACLTALAQRIRPRLWLLGTTEAEEVPEGLLATAEDQLDGARRTWLAERLKDRPGQKVADLNRSFDDLLRAREIQLNLRILRRICGADRVHYLRCDVRHRAQVMRAARQVYDRERRVDLLVHGAGLIRSAGVKDKALDDFCAVRDTKVTGYHHLKEAFADPAPVLWCNFGSGSALTGCVGDTDYSPANEYLFAAARATSLHTDAEFTLGWGLWHQTGMVKHLAAHITRTLGISGLDNDAGAAVFLTELATPRSLEPAPMYVLGDSWGVKGGPDFAPEPVPAGGLLGAPDHIGSGQGRWTWQADPRRDSYLAEHLLDGRPLLPAVMMLAMAAEAARFLQPGQAVTGFRDMTIEQPLYTDAGGRAASCRIDAATLGDGTVRVRLRSDLHGPGGRVLVADRLHCQVDVLIGTLNDPPVEQAPPPAPAMPDCPAVRPDTTVQLSGVWRTNMRPGSNASSGTALWAPRLDPDGTFAHLAVPALLIDSLGRLFGYPSHPGGEQAMGAPVSIAGIDLYTAHTDTELAHAHPEGLRLWFRAAQDRAVAATADGSVLVAITALKFTTVDLVERDTIGHRAWDPS